MNGNFKLVRVLVFGLILYVSTPKRVFTSVCPADLENGISKFKSAPEAYHPVRNHDKRFILN